MIMINHHRHIVRVLWALLLGSASAQNYQLAPAILDLGGSRGVSSNHTMDGSSGPGTAGSSANYSLRAGFAGQLLDAVSLGITASPTTVNETATRQLAATLSFDDSTQLPLAASSVSWSVQSGPIAGIDSAGLVTAGAVAADTAATVAGQFSGLSGTLSLTVLENIRDNFGVYAGDGLPDPWQVQYFGPANPQAGPNANPDQDVWDNLHEFAFGIDPGNPSSGAGAAGILYDGGLITRRGPPVMTLTDANQFEVVFARRKGVTGLAYLVQYSNELGTWFDISVTPEVVAADTEMEAVKITFPFSLPANQNRRLFRVAVTLLP